MNSLSVRTTFTSAEVEEIRALLDDFPAARLAVQRTTTARLRRLSLDVGDVPTRQAFDDQVDAGVLRLDDSGAAMALIEPQPSGRVFRVAVGVKGYPVAEDWDAFAQSFQWFGQQPRSIASGDHLFALAVDRWRSAVVGLYEAVSAGADRLPGSPDPERWPWAVGVRPLAAIYPPDATRIDGLYGPQSGLPTSIPTDEDVGRLYAAVAGSRPAPGPSNLEQRIQQLEPLDVADDVIEAVRLLGAEARRTPVVDRAIKLGAWTQDELSVRAWYTGTGDQSHVRNIVAKALDREVSLTQRLVQLHGRYSERERVDAQFGATYRPAANRAFASDELPPHVPDLAELDRATRRHMEMQDALAVELRRIGIAPRSPGAGQPQFDLAFESSGARFVVEVKSSNPVAPQQMRLGVGQVLEYRHLLASQSATEVIPLLLVEAEPPKPWTKAAEEIGVRIIRSDRLAESLSAAVAAQP